MNLKTLQKSLLHTITNGKNEDFIELCTKSSINLTKLFNSSLNKLSQSSVHLACIYDRPCLLDYIWEKSDMNQTLFMTKDSCYKEPLHHACQHGSRECVNWLLSHITEINVNSMKKADWTPLMLCIVGKLQSIDSLSYVIESLISHGADVTLLNKDGWTAFHLACKDMRVYVIEQLAKASPQCCIMRSKNGRTPLHTSALSGNLEATQYLLLNNTHNANSISDVNVTDDCGTTPLMDALIGGHCQLGQWLLEEAHASLDRYDRRGRHTVHVVCESAPLSAVTFLLDRYPFLIDLRTLRGNSTPLMVAARGKRLNVVEFLLARGASRVFVDDSGRTFDCFL